MEGRGEKGCMTSTVPEEWMFNKHLMDDKYGAHFESETILPLLSEKGFRVFPINSMCINRVLLFSHQVLPDCLPLLGLKHTRVPCPSLSPEFAQTQVHLLCRILTLGPIYNQIHNGAPYFTNISLWGKKLEFKSTSLVRTWALFQFTQLCNAT